jgi:N-methylhydantoinase A
VRGLAGAERGEVGGGQRRDLAGGHGGQLGGGERGGLGSGQRLDLRRGQGGDLAGGQGLQVGGGQCGDLCGGECGEVGGGERSVLVPLTPSTFCALGAILANVKRDFVSSRFLRLADGDLALQTLTGEYDRLEQIAARWIGSEGDILGSTRYEVSADIRYVGQAFELPVQLTESLRRMPDAGRLTDLFHQAHEKVYSFRDLASSVEITAERLRVVGEIPPVTLPRLLPKARSAAAPTTRDLFLDGGFVTAAVYQRDDLQDGQMLTGPAIIEQEDTTTIVLPGWSATVDEIGNLLIARSKESP